MPPISPASSRGSPAIAGTSWPMPRGHRSESLASSTAPMQRSSIPRHAAAPWCGAGYALDCGTHRQHGGAKPPRHLGCDERPRRGRRHQPGQPAPGVARVQDGGEGVRTLAKPSELRAPTLLHSPWGYDDPEFLRYSNRQFGSLGTCTYRIRTKYQLAS